MSSGQSIKDDGREQLIYELVYKQMRTYLDSDRVDDGLNFVTQLQNKLGETVSAQDQLVIDVLICILQNRVNKITENLQLISKLDGIIHYPLMLFDYTIAKADTLWKAGKQMEALTAIETIEENVSKYKNDCLLTDPANFSQIIEREVDIQHIKGVIFWYLGEVRESQRSFEQAYNLVGNIDNKLYLASTLNDLGNIYSYQGDIQLALTYHKKALEIRKNLTNRTDLACSLANIAEMYQYMGNYDFALGFYKQAQFLFESLNNIIFLGQLYHDLINVYLVRNEITEAKANLEKLRQLESRPEENLFVHTYYLLSEGLILKNSDSLITKFKSAENFLRIANAPVVDSSLTAQAIFNFVDLLLLEVKLTQKEENLLDIHIWLKKLFVLAEEQNSSVLQIQCYLLDSKLKLLEFKIIEAKEILSNAYELATQKGIIKFENLLKREMNQLIEQEDKWEALRAKGATFIERINLTGLESTLENLIRRRQERPELVKLIIENIGNSIQNEHDFYDLLLKETYITIFREFKLGPEIYVSDDLNFSKTNKILLETKLGVFFITAVGQGGNSNTGLFGPLPVPDSPDYVSIIYACFLKDTENTDPRNNGNSYCLFVVTFPKTFEPFYSNRSALSQIFQDFLKKFEKLQDIKQNELTDLKLLLIK